MGFDLKLLWNFPIGILRLVAFSVIVIAASLIADGHYPDLEKEVITLAAVSCICILTLVWMTVIASGKPDVLTDNRKKIELVFSILSLIVLIAVGAIMLYSIFKDRPSCRFLSNSKTTEPCQKKFAESVAGGALALIASLIYGTLGFYLYKDLYMLN